jgi:hypothetical protein
MAGGTRMAKAPQRAVEVALVAAPPEVKPMPVLSCADCGCWVHPKPISADDDPRAIGTCRRRPPVLGYGGRGVWPLTLSTEGCGDGVPL